MKKKKDSTTTNQPLSRLEAALNPKKYALNGLFEANVFETHMSAAYEREKKCVVFFRSELVRNYYHLMISDNEAPIRCFRWPITVIISLMMPTNKCPAQVSLSFEMLSIRWWCIILFKRHKTRRGYAAPLAAG